SHAVSPAICCAELTTLLAGAAGFADAFCAIAGFLSSGQRFVGGGLSSCDTLLVTGLSSAGRGPCIRCGLSVRGFAGSEVGDFFLGGGALATRKGDQQPENQQFCFHETSSFNECGYVRGAKVITTNARVKGGSRN